MDMYRSFIPQAEQMLGNLRAWFDKAEAHAKSLNYDANVLLSARLAPDQFALARQVQTCCDTAKLTAARLTGKDAPVHEDTEQTMDELRNRIDATLAFLKTLSPTDFAGADARIIPLAFLPGQGATGADYVFQFALPNLYFHLTTAYQLLRHNGVPVGKQDFIGRITLQAL